MSECTGLIMIDGGRGESSEVPASAVDRFNRMAMDNPLYGHNRILDTMSHFDNSARYSFDEEPELDEYVQTLFINGLGDKGYDVNGDPYGEFKKMQGDLVGSTDAPSVDTSSMNTSNAAAFLNSFGKLFEKRT